MDRLERKITEARPQLDAAARERLDARFAGRAAQRRRGGVRVVAPALGGLCALVMAVAIVAPELTERAPSSGSGGSGLIARQTEESASAPDLPIGDRSASDARDIARPGPGEAGLHVVPPIYPQPEPGPEEPRRIERSAFIELEARDVEQAAAEAGRIADRHGGYVLEMDISRSGGASLSLRVPVRRYSAAMGALAELGEVRDRGETSRDVTAGFVHVRERLAQVKARRTSLLRQLERAKDESERRSIEAQLQSTDAELRAARAERRSLEGRTEYAQISVSIRDPEAAERRDEEEGLTPALAFERALGGLLWLASAAILIVVVAAPPLVLAALAWAAWRRWRRRG